MATHSSTLALKIPWTEELGAGYCPWDRKESGTTERLHFTSLTQMSKQTYGEKNVFLMTINKYGFLFPHLFKKNCCFL